jgi:glutamate/tyrosine decarboxylase-like PLP-dependent enzyme
MQGHPNTELAHDLGTAPVGVRNRLRTGAAEVEHKLVGRLRGKPDTPPLPVALAALQAFQPLNPNNAGIHRLGDVGANNPWRSTRQLEAEAVAETVELLGENRSRCSGYLNSGSTEGNITAMWWARKRATSQGRLLRVIAPATVHYSVTKAVDLLGLDGALKLLPVDHNLQVSPAALDTALAESRRERRSVLVIATAITTATGTIDALSPIEEILDRHPDVPSGIHLDAAIGGLLVPFTEGWQPWSERPSLLSVTVDWHKLAGVPYSAGMLVFRSGAEAYGQPVAMISTGLDETVLGSRSGATAGAVWATLRSLGADGLTHRARRCVALRNSLLESLKDDLALEVHAPPASNVAAIRLSASDPAVGRLAAQLEPSSVYPSSVAGHPDDVYFPAFCMPHNTEDEVGRFVEDVRSALNAPRRKVS